MGHLNQQLKTEISIDGPTSLSLFSHFPSLSCSLDDVKIKDLHKEGDYLLNAESISFLFNLSDWWNNKISFNKLALNDAVINIRIDENGKNNFEIFKESTTNENTNQGIKQSVVSSDQVEEIESKMDIDGATFSNCKINYFNEMTKAELQLVSESAEFDFSSAKQYFDLKLEGDGHIKAYKIDTIVYLKDKLLGLDLDFKSNLKENEFVFKNSEIELDGIPVFLNGKIINDGEISESAFSIETKNLEFKKLFELLREAKPEFMMDWNMDGELDLNMSFNGVLKSWSDLKTISEGNVALDIEELQWKKVNAEDIKGNLCFSDGHMYIEDFDFEMMDGTGFLNANIHLEENDMDCHLKLEEMDLQEFLLEYNDFEEFVSEENVRGKLNLNLLLESGLDKNWNIEKDKVKGFIDFEILKGQLIDFEPIVSMVGPKEQKRMRKISFHPIKNQLKIENRILRIPKMAINSNLVNIDFSGKYTLQNNLNFHFKVDLLDYFNKRFFKNNKEGSEKNRKGGINYYCSLFGSVEEPLFKGKSKRFVLGAFEKDAYLKKANLDMKANENYDFQCDLN